MPRNIVYILIIAMISAIGVPRLPAQIVADPEIPAYNPDSVREAFDRQPYFGLYKDNYFIFGPAIGPEITKKNTNVKFQVSISQRLTKSTLPGGFYLFLFYTQKCFWNVLEKSMPMTDLNFNPGIGISKPLFVKDRFIGKATIILEHESNGRDSTASRSWNRLSFGGNILIDPRMMIHGKFWIPIVDGQYNKDLLDYVGLYQTGFSVMPPSQRWVFSVIVTKRKGWNLNFNTVVELSYRLSNRENQYLFAQYYNGYGEGLLDYKQFHSQLRVGIVIKPRFFSDF